MTQAALNQILKMIDQRISNLSKDLVLTPKGVQHIMIQSAIDELTYLKWAISNSKDEIYTVTGFKYQSL